MLEMLREMESVGTPFADCRQLCKMPNNATSLHLCRPNETFSCKAIQVGAGSLYLAVLFLAFINSTSVQTPVSFDRGVSYRETAAGMYGQLPFALAACTVEVPYILLQVNNSRQISLSFPPTPLLPLSSVLHI